MERRAFDVFVSYNRADEDLVHRIAERLRQERLRPWVDKWVLTPGRSWQEEIVEGLANASTCAVMVGPSGLGDWAREELAVAQDRAAKDRDFRMFMVLLPGAPDVGDASLAFLRTRTWVDMRAGTADPASFQSLVNAITGAAPAAPPVNGDGADELVCPYRGLASFEPEHAEYFFGREDDTAQILELLRDRRFLAVLGPSGSGKSSLVRAGVVSALQAGRVPGSESWTVRIFTPGAHPLTALAAQLARVLPGRSMQRTLDEMGADQRSLDLAVTLALSDAPPDRRLVLVADQFEEAFTLCADDGERRAFFENLLYAATIPGGRVVVILAMRADFYHLCAGVPELRAQVAAQQFLVGPLAAEGLRRAIEEPARRVGVELQSGLLETILADIGDRPGTLPLLQHVLFEVWQRRRGRMLTLDAYVASGKVEGALAHRANSVYQGLPPGEQEVARRVLLRLVQPGEGTEDTRRQAPMEELVLHDADRDAVERVVEALARERLVTSGHDDVTGHRVVDITHEALIRGWPELRAWVADHRDALRSERRLTEAALEWSRSWRDDGLLYRGARLAEWEGRDPAYLNDLEREFLEASRQRQAREQAAGRRRARFAIGGALTAVTAVAAVSLIGLVQVKQEQNVAASRLAIANSAAQIEREPLRALLLALEAYRLAPNEASEQAVRLATSYAKVRGQVDVPAASTPSFSPDGRQVAVGGLDGTVRLWDWTAPGPTRVLGAHPPGSTVVRFSPDGRTLASVGADDAVRLWDVATGAPASALRGHQPQVASVAYSSDGRWLASAGTGDGTVRIWDPHEAREVAVLPVDGGRPTSVAFTPDGDGVVAGVTDRTVRTWNWAAGGPPSVLSGHTGPVAGVAVDPDGSRIAGAGLVDGEVRVWERATGNVTVLEYRDGPVVGVAFSPDGRWVAAGGLGGAIRLWELGTGREPLVLRGHAELVRGIGFSPDGRLLASGSVDGTVRVWDWAGDVGTTAFEARGALFTAAWSRDGRHVATAGLEGIVRIVDWATGAVRQELRGHAGAITRLTFSTDGTKVVSSGIDGTIRVWDVTSSAPPVVVRGPGGAISSAAVGADGRTLVWTGMDAAVRKRDLETGREEQLDMPPSSRTTALLDREGRRLVVPGADGVVRVFEWPSAREIHAFRGHQGNALYAAFSPDGRMLASGGSDGTVRIWDLRTGRHQVLRGHQGAAGSVSFSADGRLLVSGGQDETVRVWDVATGKGLLTLGGHRGQVIAAHFAPAGLRIASVSMDGTLRVWDCSTCGSTEEVMAMARERAVRDLTDDERAAFVPSRDPGIGVSDAVLALAAAAGLGGVVLGLARWRAARRRRPRPTPSAAPVAGEAG